MDQKEFGNVEKKSAKGGSASGGKTKIFAPKFPKERLKLPLKTRSREEWLKIGIIVVAAIYLAFYVCVIVAGVGIYKSRWDNKFAKAIEKIFPYPAAVVGSNLITMNDLSKEVGYIKYFYQKTAPDQMPDNSLIEKQVIDRLIQEKVAEKLARDNGVSVSKKEVDDQFDKIADENGGAEKVKQILSDLYGLDVKTFKDLIRDQLLQEKLRDKFEKDLQMQIKVKHILVKVAPDATPEAKAQAQAKAQDILNKIKGGADFTEMAKQFSEDEASQGQGGELPFFSKGQNVKEFETAAFSLGPGEVSDVVLTQYGFHIIKMEEKKGSINLTFEDWLNESEKKMWTWRFVGREKKTTSTTSSPSESPSATTPSPTQ
ncbi:MAG: peptidylprolyl isomerase [Candidatus Berkelbacteria bacterium]|nr:peptidylprolyl isomerase [Candidatus Berkelbacteria bacterium]